MVKMMSLRKKFLIQSFWRYFVIILIPIFLIEPVILFKTYQEINTEITSQNSRLLSQAESILLDMQQNVSNISFYFSQSDQAGYVAKAILNRSTLDADMMDSIDAVNQYLQSMQNTYSSIYSIYVYYDNIYGRFFSSRDGMCKIQDYYDHTWLGEYLDSDRDIWYSGRSVQEYNFAEVVPVVTVYRKMYTGNSGDSSVGVVAVSYRKDKLEKDINNLSLYDNQTIIMLNQEGEVLLQNRKMNLEKVLERFEQKQEGAFFLEGKLYFVSALQSSQQKQLTIVSMIPFVNLYKQLLLLSQVIGLSLLAALVLSIGLAWTSARKDMRRLNDVVALLNHEVEPGQMRNQIKADYTNMYDYILFNILQLFMEQDYLKMQYSERRYRMEVLNLQVLQHQINPHFMNNTLNGIYWEAIKLSGGSNNCSDMIDKLSKVMKYTMEDSIKEITVWEEMNYLDIYQDIQSVRYKKDLGIVWEVDREAREGIILKMLLQPLVENAVYHGIKEKQFQGRMKCRIRKKGEHLYFYVIDTGMGVTKKTEEEIRLRLQGRSQTEEHVGLYNTNLRLILRYGEDAQISFRSKYGMGTILQFRIPYIKRRIESKKMND